MVRVDGVADRVVDTDPVAAGLRPKSGGQRHDDVVEHGGECHSGFGAVNRCVHFGPRDR